MSHAVRRRLLRSVLVLALVAGTAALVAQLAGVTGSQVAGDDLVIGEQTNEWVVQLPEGQSTKRDGAALEDAIDELADDGRFSTELPGGWRVVRLGEDVTSAEAEVAFGEAGALDVEPVVPRVIYAGAEPDAVSDGAAVGAAPRESASPEPDVVHDGPEAFDTSFRDKLRAGNMRATRLREQWALEQASDVDIDGTEAWTQSTGTGAVVAVIDTGVDANHPDLRGRVLDGMNFSAANVTATTDTLGHGTHVASIIAAGGTGMAGVAPDARIMPLRVFGNSTGSFSFMGYISAIKYAADNGADVINVSLGCGGSTSCYSQAEFDAIRYANDKGVLVVAAAGNGDASGAGMNNDAPSTPDYPSDYDLPNIISVTSTTKLGGWSSWANYGARNVDLAAPGESILSASSGGGYTNVTGTSFSAPMVSGTLALLAAKDPAATSADLRARLLRSVQRVNDLVPRTVSGGTLNANTALATGISSVSSDIPAPVLDAPASGAKVASPAVMAWRLPAGWKSSRVELKGPGGTFTVRTSAAARAASQPMGAWRSGTYRWRVVVLNASGTATSTAWSTYRLLPRTSSSVSSGRLSSNGRTLRMRVGYATTETKATVKVRVLVGKRVIHSGKARSYSQHSKGSGFPRRGWLAYSAKLSRALGSGVKVRVEVTVVSGGIRSKKITTAKVA